MKAHLSLWLAGRGANDITVSVDGAEPEPMALQGALARRGFVQEQRGPRWGGVYRNKQGAAIAVISKPGIDIWAKFPEGRFLAVECKGEPTAAGVRAGTDIVAFYTGLGQLVVTSGRLPEVHDLALAVPDTPRFRALAVEASQNRLVIAEEITLILVSFDGTVHQITPQSRL